MDANPSRRLLGVLALVSTLCVCVQGVCPSKVSIALDRVAITPLGACSASKWVTVLSGSRKDGQAVGSSARYWPV